jgi:hypothetical protein
VGKRARPYTRNEMNSERSASAVARELGTSVPRVVRAAQRLGYDTREEAGRLELSAAQRQRLRAELGCRASAPGLRRTELAALAALANAPFGLPSARAVADAAGLAPASAAKAVNRLLRRGLVTRSAQRIAAGRPRDVQMLHVNVFHERFDELAPLLRQVQPPERRDARVPFRLAHLFWNTDPRQLELPRGGPYIARRLLRTMDPAGLAWGARNLRADDWRQAAHARGLDPASRTLALNLAAQGER